MEKVIYSVKNTTFSDIIDLGAINILESFIEVLKDEILKGNKIIIEKYEGITDTKYPLEINTLEELEEFQKSYLL
ncbi:hypothetical protein [Flavobacterium sp. LB3R33]|uniref:hypothetical protein n=1 Tax=Flavobacterium sp. LB3R33 TaxID=3401721 RepID=UPI003AABA9B9